ncbi:MAG TPA: isoleucine--tRNA ligase [Candidatus Bathyarchaeia archaeon]|nr:isoleucine--tRNA ligase [Candidatus Bathyarchaeia archaeon]
MVKKKSFFQPVSHQVRFPDIENKILLFWNKNRIFEKSIKQRSDKNPYTFYDGPPFITGLPHYGHLLGSIAKDLIPRFQTMKGKKIRRVWGWDCHGLPVEEKTERKLGLKNRREIEKIGIEKFIKECRIYVSETSAEWKWYIDHIARWVDMDRAYRTMDLEFMESVIWAFKKLYDRGLIYRGLKTLLYCTRCGTPISKFEIAMDNSYASMQDPAVTVEFVITTAGPFQQVRLLAWTTTPWTLPSNRALVVDPNESYVEFEDKSRGRRYIAAQKRIKDLIQGKNYSQIKKFKGAKLVGLAYQPPYSYISPNKKDFRIYKFKGMVNMDEGTGIVHSAPGFGEIDTEMGRHYGLTLMFNVDDEGKFTDKITDFKGVYVKDADKLIIDDLKKREILFKEEIITHRYPYCYRCQTPLIYRAVKAWFVDIQKIKEEMLQLNENVNWVPNFFKRGRVKNTLKDAPDWCVSRTRYWATIMPIWECRQCGEFKVVGSVEEIEKNSVERIKITDLHRTSVDMIKFKCGKCQGEMKRIPEVLDVWFESGSMPYGERHYPFENKIAFEKAFPADYIVEYVGQIRAWFYYLHALSTGLFHSHCFKNVIVTGVMAGTDGRKMSKSYGNYPDPKKVLEQYGGDALRLYLMGTRLMAGADINITKGEELLEQVKTVLLPLWNSYQFFITYANLHNFEPAEKRVDNPKHILNKWIKSRNQQLINEIDKCLSSYNIPGAVRLLRPFMEDLSTWYIRRSREFFNRGDREFLQTLYQVLVLFIKGTAPIIPFITDEIYQNLVRQITQGSVESVHLCNFPPARKIGLRECSLFEKTDLVRKICSLGHAIRKEKKIKVRQPLSCLTYYWPVRLPAAFEKLIEAEVNVQEVICQIKKITDPQVKLNLRLNKELLAEGQAREWIHQIQQMRKQAGCLRDEWILVYLPQFPKSQNLRFIIKKKTLAQKLLLGKKLAIKRSI